MANPLAEELSTSRRTKPCVLVIFGATGDLTRRKLVPSLMGLAQDGLLPPGFAVVGFARREKSNAEFHEDLVPGVQQFARGQGEQTFAQMKDGVYYHTADFSDAAGYAALAQKLDEIDRLRGTQGNRIF